MLSVSGGSSRSSDHQRHTSVKALPGSDEVDSAPFLGSKDQEVDTVPFRGSEDEEVDTVPFLGSEDQEVDTVPFLGSEDQEVDTVPFLGTEDQEVDAVPVLGSDDRDATRGFEPGMADVEDEATEGRSMKIDLPPLEIPLVQ